MIKNHSKKKPTPAPTKETCWDCGGMFLSKFSREQGGRCKGCFDAKRGAK